MDQTNVRANLKRRNAIMKGRDVPNLSEITSLDVSSEDLNIDNLKSNQQISTDSKDINQPGEVISNNDNRQPLNSITRVVNIKDNVNLINIDTDKKIGNDQDICESTMNTSDGSELSTTNVSNESNDITKSRIDDSPNENTNKSRKLDRHGWYLVKQEISNRELKLIEIDSKKETGRITKWLSMTDDANWVTWITKKRSKVSARIRKGIPDSLRFRAWSLIVDANSSKDKYPFKMDELLEREKHQLYNIVDKDLNRTFNQIGFFSKPGFLESLKRILYCYCQIDPDLGYTQGMSFIAGMFLTYMDEETAFYSFISVMQAERLNQREYFTQGFPRLNTSNLLLTSLMKEKCPKVLKNMEDKNILPTMFTTGWFLTAFLSFNWTPEFQLRIFERFLFYGTRGILGFAITIIMLHADFLAEAKTGDFLKMVQHPDESERMKCWHDVLDEWNKNAISKKKYLNLLKLVGVEEEKL